MGKPLLVVLVVAAIGIPVLTLLLWTRVRGPRPARIAIRLVMLGAGQLATVALVGVVVNNYGQFYTSWSDLLGTTSPPPAVAVYGAPQPPEPATRRPSTGTSRPATGQLKVLGETTWSAKPQWSTRGRVISTTITGLGSSLAVHAYIWLPPQYFQAKYAHHKFPAVEVMTGYPGSALNLVSRMNYPGVSLNLIRHHRARPMILVMFSSTVAPPRDTECTNIAGGPQAETFIATEIPSAIDHRLRADPLRWGVIGDSTGGYCAAKVAMLHPGTFAGGVSLSGYYHALNGGTAGDLFGGSATRKHEADLRWRLKHLPAPAASLYVTIGRHETKRSEGFPETMRFLHLVKPPMHVTAVIQHTGGHNFDTWDRELPGAMTWLSERVSGHALASSQNH